MLHYTTNNCILLYTFRNNTDDNKFIFDNAKVLHRSQCERSFGEWLQCILDFAASLKAMDVDLSAFACFSALTIITGGLNYLIVIILF